MKKNVAFKKTGRTHNNQRSEKFRCIFCGCRLLHSTVAVVVQDIAKQFSCSYTDISKQFSCSCTRYNQVVTCSYTGHSQAVQLHLYRTQPSSLIVVVWDMAKLFNCSSFAVPTFPTEMYLHAKKSLSRHCKKLITNIMIFLPVITIKLKLGKN